MQVEGVLERAARREDKTERLKRESVARDAVLSMYADRFADPDFALLTRSAATLLAAQVHRGPDLAESGVREDR